MRNFKLKTSFKEAQQVVDFLNMAFNKEKANEVNIESESNYN